MSGTVDSNDGLTIDDIWHEQVVKRSSSTAVADAPIPSDIILNGFLESLRARLTVLHMSKRKDDYEAHYDAALEACRLTRRIRFQIRSSRQLHHSTRGELINTLNEVAESIHVPYDKVIAKPLTEKSLEKVQKNIRHRIEWLENGLEPDSAQN